MTGLLRFVEEATRCEARLIVLPAMATTGSCWEEKHLIQLRFLTEIIDIHALLSRLAGYQRFSGSNPLVVGYLGQGTLSPASSLVMYFRQALPSLIPPGWSVVIRSSNGQEVSFGFWWPLCERPFESLLRSHRVWSIHQFAGANRQRSSILRMRWREDGLVEVHLTCLDGTIDVLCFSPEQLAAGALERHLEALTSLLIPGEESDLPR